MTNYNISTDRNALLFNEDLKKFKKNQWPLLINNKCGDYNALFNN